MVALPFMQPACLSLRLLLVWQCTIVTHRMLQVRATMFGVPPPRCNNRACGNNIANVTGDGHATVVVSGVYKRAGR
jgi:hypothetical protein